MIYIEQHSGVSQVQGMPLQCSDTPKTTYATHQTHAAQDTRLCTGLRPTDGTTITADHNGAGGSVGTADRSSHMWASDQGAAAQAEHSSRVVTCASAAMRRVA